MAVPTAARRARSAKTKRPERGTSQESAFQQLRDLIVVGKLAPGSWIVEADLAERMGLSRTPIRGALQLLQNEGFVVEHKSGTKTRMMVAPLTMSDAHELYAIVGKLERMAGSCVARLDDEAKIKLADRLEGINRTVEELASAGKGSSARAVFDLDDSFHNVFVEAAAGPRLLALHRAVKPQIERYWRLYASTILNDLHHSVAEHDEIIAAIRRGDVAAIESSIEANWERGFERITKLIEIFGERGSW